MANRLKQKLERELIETQRTGKKGEKPSLAKVAQVHAQVAQQRQHYGRHRA
jgi:hypothetical protein